MEIVRTGLRHKAHLPALRPAVLGLEAVRIHGELADGIERRRVHGRPLRLQRPARVGRNAVERHSVSRRLSAANGEVVVAVIRRLHFGRQQRQIKRRAQLAAHHERQLVYQPVRYRGLNPRVFRLHLQRRRRNLNRLLRRTYFERHVDARRARCRHNNVVGHRSLEARLLDADRVGANFERRQRVVARIAGRNFDHRVRFRARRRNAGIRDHGPGAVLHNSRNQTPILLRVEAKAGEGEEQP